MIRGKLTQQEWVAYVVTQLVAGVIGGLLATRRSPATSHAGAARQHRQGAAWPSSCSRSRSSYVVLNVATASGTEGNSFYGLAIGFTVLAGAFAVGGSPAAPSTRRSRSARSSTARSASRTIWKYWLAQFIAGAVAGWVFLMVQSPRRPRHRSVRAAAVAAANGAVAASRRPGLHWRPADVQGEPRGPVGLADRARRGRPVRVAVPDLEPPVLRRVPGRSSEHARPARRAARPDRVAGVLDRPTSCSRCSPSALLAPRCSGRAAVTAASRAGRGRSRSRSRSTRWRSRRRTARNIFNPALSVPQYASPGSPTAGAGETVALVGLLLALRRAAGCRSRRTEGRR